MYILGEINRPLSCELFFAGKREGYAKMMPMAPPPHVVRVEEVG
jgi:hypothetical protein